jgi:uroporphyrin-3 C-methyltransferase
VSAPQNVVPPTPESTATLAADARLEPVVPPAAVASASASQPLSRPWIVGFGVTAVVALVALAMSWSGGRRLETSESELVKRQQEAAGVAAEARALSRQAEALTRESAAKLALLETRVAETSLQRTQLEELIQALARSRDENLLADVEAAVRVAMQQSAITGSAEPLANALRQADERLARYPQPRIERVRRAIVQDLERLRAAGLVDLPSLTIRVDEVVRQVDDLPLVAGIDRRGARREPGASAPPPAQVASAPAGAASSSSSAWPRWIDEGLRLLLTQVWFEVRDLVRVTRVNDPEALLLAPEQAFFLRENLKLRLLNARLALLSRQFDVAQADLREAQQALERYFDRSSRRVTLVVDLLRQTAAQARQVNLPRPDATLAALATAAAGR